MYSGKIIIFSDAFILCDCIIILYNVDVIICNSFKNNVMNVITLY